VDHSAGKQSSGAHVSEALFRASPDSDPACEGDDEKALRKTAGSPAFLNVRDAKVRDLNGGVVLGPEEIGWLDVAVNDALVGSQP
jgi:hypothetical protein